MFQQIHLIRGGKTNVFKATEESINLVEKMRERLQVGKGEPKTW